MRRSLSGPGEALRTEVLIEKARYLSTGGTIPFESLLYLRVTLRVPTGGDVAAMSECENNV